MRALGPLGVAIGLPPFGLIGSFPAVNGYFVIPNYPTVAAINFDRTGTTGIEVGAEPSRWGSSPAAVMSGSSSGSSSCRRPGPSRPNSKEEIMASTKVRMEHDFLGDREVRDACYGVQTLRGAENFPITGYRIHLAHRAMGIVKAAALANRDSGHLDLKIADAIARA